MATNRKEKPTFRSMEEFRSRYFSTAPRRKVIIGTPEEARALGIEMARETVKNMKKLKIR